MSGGVLMHILRRASRSLWENLYLNAVATGVIAAALLLVGVTLTVQQNLSALVDSWDRDVHISAYFHHDVPEARRFDKRDQVAQDPRVVGVRYISEADAQDWLLERTARLEGVLEELGPAALPASLEITLAAEAGTPGEVARFATDLEDPDLEFIDFGQEWVEHFNAFLSLLELLAAVLGSLIFLAAVFLVINTVNLVVFNRRDELEVQKLVGATNATITAPFLLEGLAQGLVGGGLALVGLWTVHRLVVVRLQIALGLHMAGDLAALSALSLLGLVMAGAVLGLLAAWLAVARFLSRAP